MTSVPIFLYLYVRRYVDFRVRMAQMLVFELILDYSEYTRDPKIQLKSTIASHPSQ
jgi:hypothetical protein